MLLRCCAAVGLLWLVVLTPRLHAQDATRGETLPQAVRIRQTTASFRDVVNRVEAFVAQYTAPQVLLVLDIDNTLLAMNQDLGSDQWFNWQEQLQEAEPNSPDLISPEFPDLLRAQGMLFSLSAMHAPEPELPAFVSQIQDLGVATVVLTSRGPEFRNSAQRELEANGYDLMRNAFDIRERRGYFFPFDVNRPGAHGLTAGEMRGIQDRMRRVTYSNGLYMTAGQHKGFMLRTLLARAAPINASTRAPRTFKAIVFVDDHEKHVLRMHEAFDGLPIDLATFRYSREDGNVAKFQASTKRHVVDDWKDLEAFMVNGMALRPRVADGVAP